MSEPPVLVTISEQIATVTLNRPARLNALTAESIRLLTRHLRELDEHPAVRVVIVTGAGRAFCAGGDVDELADGHLSAELIRRHVRLCEVLFALRPITIAAVNGPCAGGGMALACAADLRLAADSAFFTSAFVAIGTPGDMGLGWHLVRLLGLARAKELSLLPGRLSAAHALGIGLVNRITAPGELQNTARELAQQLASTAQPAVEGMKQNLNAATQLDLATFLDVESGRFAANSGSKGAVEAARSFTRRRTHD